MKVLSKLSAIIALIVVVLVVFSGCGQEQSNTNNVPQMTNQNEDNQSSVETVTEDTAVESDASSPKSETLAEDSEAPEIETPEIEEQGEVVTRSEVIKTLYEYDGSPVLDFSSIQKYDKITVTDMDANDEMTKWYAYAIRSRGATQNTDGTFTLDGDKNADRLFVAQMLLSDMVNRGYRFEKMDESIVPYEDLLDILDSEYYACCITFLCEEGILNKSENPNQFEPEREITDVELAHIIEAVDEELNRVRLGGDISICLGSNLTIGVSVPVKSDKDNIEKAELANEKNKEDAKSTNKKSDEAIASPEETISDTKETNKNSEETINNPDESIKNPEKTASPSNQNIITTANDKFVAAGYHYTGLNTANPYTTECFENTNHTSGKLTFINYERVSKNDKYDTITLTAKCSMGDDNAKTGGFTSYYGIENAYDYTEGKLSIGAIYDDEKLNNFSIEYNGTVYDECSAESIIHKQYILASEWDKGKRFEVPHDFIITIPKGYDGIVVWISGYPGDDYEFTGYKNLSTLDSLYAFRCY